MEKSSSKFSFEKCDLSNLTPDFLENIYNIEQDCIAGFYNEYKVCNGCGEIYDKETVYGDVEDYQKLSINELEKEYPRDFISPCCQSESHSYRDKSKVDDIQSRLQSSVLGIIDGPIKSYCTTVKDEVGDIVGVCYGYVDTIENINERELKFHFSPEILNHPKIKELDESTFFTICGVFFYQKFMKSTRSSIQLILKLLHEFSENVDDEHKNTTGIFEAKLGSASLKIFERMGAECLNLQEDIEKYYATRDGVQLLGNYDAYIHQNMIEVYRNLYKKNVLGK